MILDQLKDRFVIVARQGNSAEYEPNSARALASAFPDADIIHTDITACNNGVLFCTKDTSVGVMTREEAEDQGYISLRELMNWAKKANKDLLLEPRTNSAALVQRISGDARFFGMEDRISIVARSLRQTSIIRTQNDKIGIVGFLRKPEQYAEFYRLGGNVATLKNLTTTPLNVRLAEAAEGRHRHPFLVLAGKVDAYDVNTACNGLVGAKGIIMRNPDIGRAAMERRAAPTPACAGCAPD